MTAEPLLPEPGPSSKPPPGPRGRAGSRSRRYWVGGVLVVLACGAGGYAWLRHAADGGASGAASSASAPVSAASGVGGGRRFGGGNRVQPVSAQAARRQNLRVVVTAIGTINAVNTATVRARVDGELRRVLFKEGQQVKAGQVLAELDPRPFEVALAQAQGQWARDNAQLKNAQLDLERYRDLLSKDAIARQQVDTQEALVRQLQGTVQADQAQVDSAKLQLSFTRITAPIAGRLGLRLVDPGNMVRAGDASGLVTITQTQPVSVVFAVPEAHVPAIQRKLRANEALGVEAWDREQRNRLAQGRVTTTDNAIDTATGTLKVKAEFGNADGQLFPNQFVNIRLELDTLQDALVVPGAAIQRGAIGTFVYLVREDGTVAVRRVRTGAVEGDWVSVQGELRPGDRLVTDGADRLREGAKVEVIVAPRPGAAFGTGRGGAAAGAASGAASGGARATASEAVPGAGAAPPGSPLTKAARGGSGPQGADGATPARRGASGAARPGSGASVSGGAGGAGPGAAGAPAGEGGRPAWMDRLPPELVERLKAMPPEERREFLMKLRERRQQREGGG